MTATSDQFLKRMIQDYEFWAPRMFFIRDKRNELVPLLLNKVQLEMGRIEQEELEKHGNARIYCLKARQGGISTDQQARSLHKVWGRPGAVALTLAHSREDTDKLFQITRRAVKEAPASLMPKMGRSEAKEISFPNIDTHFWTGTAGAKRVGRGITITRCHGSEFAFWEKPKSILASVTPAMIPQGSVIVLETTPDAYGSEAHKFWEESEKGKTGYRTVFFPWWDCDPVYYRMPLLSDDELHPLTKEENDLMERAGVDLEQIKWRRMKIREIGRSEFLREYPEDAATCWMTGGNKFYNAEVIASLLPRAPEPLETRLEGRLKIYDSRSVRTKIGIVHEDVIIGCDVSEGSGGDRSAWTARSFPSWRLLAQFEDEKTEPNDLADILNYWGREEFGEAILVVEKNFHGITVLRRLRDTLKYPRRSIFHRPMLARDRAEKTDLIGWTTTGESKPLMLDYGREILNAAAEGTISVPTRSTLVDAWAVADGILTGRDCLVSEMLTWAGREFAVKRRIALGKPTHWSG